MKKRILGILVMVMMIALANFEVVAASETANKTIIISVDRLDFSDIEEIGGYYSCGLISLKSGMGYNSSMESQFMTIATGRRVKVDFNSFEGLKTEGESIEVLGYSDILDQLDGQYKGFTEKMNFLGEDLNINGVRTSYMGNKPDILLIADKSGQVDFGLTAMDYDKESLNEKIDLLLEKSEILLISYDLEHDKTRMKLLSELIEEREEDVIVFPRSITGDIDYRLNKTIAPIVYKSGEQDGILTSESTKRDGIVSNLDIMVTLLSKHKIEQRYPLGNAVEVKSFVGNKVESVENTLVEFLNLNIIKYVFHGLVILVQLIFILAYLFKKKIGVKYQFLILTPSVSVLLSLILGVTPLSKYLFSYIAVLIIGSLILSKYLKDMISKKSDTIEYIAIATNLFVFVFLYLNKEILYNSFIGYNNIVAAGRFYGFNNDIMGIFIGTSILTYFHIAKEERKKLRYIALAYIVFVAASHTESYGNNFGGLLTASFLALMMVYCELFRNRGKKWTMALVAAAVVLAVAAAVYIGGEGSHMGEFFIRVREYGLTEFWDMIRKKAGQLIYMVLLPQWGIMVLLQSLFLFKYVKEESAMSKREKTKYILFYITSVFALLINDTGVVSFVYMTMYLVSKSLLNREAETKGKEMA